MVLYYLDNGKKKLNIFGVFSDRNLPARMIKKHRVALSSLFKKIVTGKKKKTEKGHYSKWKCACPPLLYYSFRKCCNK